MDKCSPSPTPGVQRVKNDTIVRNKTKQNLLILNTTPSRKHWSCIQRCQLQWEPDPVGRQVGPEANNPWQLTMYCIRTKSLRTCSLKDNVVLGHRSFSPKWISRTWGGNLATKNFMQQGKQLAAEHTPHGGPPEWFPLRLPKGREGRETVALEPPYSPPPSMSPP